VHAVLAKGGVWVPITDLFGIEGNTLLDTVTISAPYMARIASLRMEQVNPDENWTRSILWRNLHTERVTGITSLCAIMGQSL
jgi:hypothetical protein